MRTNTIVRVETVGAHSVDNVVLNERHEIDAVSQIGAIRLIAVENESEEAFGPIAPSRGVDSKASKSESDDVHLHWELRVVWASEMVDEANEASKLDAGQVAEMIRHCSRTMTSEGQVKPEER